MKYLWATIIIIVIIWALALNGLWYISISILSAYCGVLSGELDHRKEIDKLSSKS